MTEAPKGYEPDHPPVFDGGTPQDHADLLRLYFDLRLANDGLDNDALRKIWNPDPGRIYFNTNGHAYHGLEDWLSIWDTTHASAAREAGRVRHHPHAVRGDLALITDDRVGRYWKWMGQEVEPRSWPTSHISGRPGLRGAASGDDARTSPPGGRQRPDQGGPE
jgi:hypothetical protein